MAGEREGTRKHRARSVLVLQLLGRRHAPVLCHTLDRSVFIIGQAGGLVIYLRNIYFIWLGKRQPTTTDGASHV